MLRLGGSVRNNKLLQNKEKGAPFTEEKYIELGINAYDIYCEGGGLTEYEAVEKAVEEWCELPIN